MNKEKYVCCNYCLKSYLTKVKRRDRRNILHKYFLFPNTSKLTEHFLETHFHHCWSCKTIVIGDYFSHMRMDRYREIYDFPLVNVRGKKRLMLKKQLWINQDRGKCYVCGTQLGFDKKSLLPYAIIEHNHYNGEIRGLSCSSCNTYIGHKDYIQY